MLFLVIEWQVSPIFLDLGFIELRWYSIFFALGVALAYWLAYRYFRQAGISDADFDKLSLWVIVGGIVGARLGHCLFYDLAYFSQHPLEIILPFRFSPQFQFVGYQGLASHGGAIGVLLALLVAHLRLAHISTLFILDVLALGVPLTGAMIRTGNLMNSEMIGKASEVSWAVVFKTLDDLPRHPAQVYEALAYLLIFSLLHLYFKRFYPLGQGRIFAWFLILLFSARFAIEFFKENQVAFEQGLWLNMGQILSVPFIGLGIILLIWKTQVVNQLR
jgi:phosphatidylglycerol---prolipoprotein diacylglyceryl transferase